MARHQPDRELAELHAAARAADMLRAIVEGVESETGERFFPSLVRHLAGALGVRYSFVSELTHDRSHFRTLAVWGNGGLLANFEVPLGGTPCERVLNGCAAHHADHLQQLFPEDVGLVDWQAQSYAGVPMVDTRGVIVGHLAILDDRPMPDGERATAILRIFAARTCAEIERSRTEATLRQNEQRLSRVIESAMDAIITFDAEERIVLLNGTAEKMFSCRAAEARDRPLDRFLTPAFRHALDRWRVSFGRGELGSAYLWSPAGLTARRANGAEFPIEATISHVEVEGQALYTLIIRDIDERRRSEQNLRRLDRENAYLQEEIRALHNADEIVGASAAWCEVLRQVALVGATDAAVLILGETGTGKELIARAVHAASSRKDRPLIKVNCAALPSGLIESELFGHERGSFTGATNRRTGRFELADGGTIFLDEIGEISPDVQVKLLRVLQEREFELVGSNDSVRVDVRVIAATNRDLRLAVERGTFREDLYYRLNVFPLRLPPLRERRDDIALLAHYFVQRFAAKVGRCIERVPEQTWASLAAYAWPGNVRELENVIERAVILSSGSELALPPGFLPPAPVPATAAPPSPPAMSPGLQQVERDHIVTVLRHVGWRIEGPNGAAARLNLHPNTLRSRIKKLNIRRSDEVS